MHANDSNSQIQKNGANDRTFSRLNNFIGVLARLELSLLFRNTSIDQFSNR